MTPVENILDISQTTERLIFKIEKGEPWMGWVTITPGMAQSVLSKTNTHNRPLRPGLVKKYARQMVANEWRKVSVPLIFSVSGKLIDGQHRLAAVLDAAKQQAFLVVIGEPDDNFGFIDQGAKRSASDIFSIHGVKNANHVAAISKFMAAYKIDKISGRRGLPFHNFDNPEQQYAFLQKLDEKIVQEAAGITNKFGRVRMPSPTIFGAVFYILAEKSQSHARKFMHGILTGEVENPTKSPVFKLRDKILRGNYYRLALAGDLIQAWNAERANKRVSQWYSDKGGKFPRAL